MAEQSVDLLLELGLQDEVALKDWADFYDTVRRKAGKPIDVPIAVDATLSELKTEIRAALVELGKLKDGFTKAEKEARDLEAEMARFANQMNAAIPDAGTKLLKAFQQGGEKGLRALEALQKKAKEFDSQNIKPVDFDVFEQQQYAPKVIRTLRERLQLMEHIKELQKEMLEIERNAVAQNQKASDHPRYAELQEALTMYKDKTGGPLEANADKLRAYMGKEGAAKVIQELADRFKIASGQGGALAEQLTQLIARVRELGSIKTSKQAGILDVTDKIDALRKAARETKRTRIAKQTRAGNKEPPPITPPGVEGADVIPIPPTTLAATEEALKAFFASKTFLARVGADPEYLFHSLTTALESFAGKGLKVAMGATIPSAVVQEVAATTAKAVGRATRKVKSERQREDDALVSRASRRAGRIVTPVKDPFDFLTSSSRLSSRLGGKYFNLLDTLQTGGAGDIKSAIPQAHDFQRSLFSAAADKKRYSLETRKQLEALAKQIPSLLIKPLRDRLGELENLAKKEAAAEGERYQAWLKEKYDESQAAIAQEKALAKAKNDQEVKAAKEAAAATKEAENDRKYKERYQDRAAFRRGIQQSYIEDELLVRNARKENRASTLSKMRGQDPIAFIEQTLGKRMADLARTMNEAFKDHTKEDPAKVKQIMEDASLAAEKYNDLLIESIKKTGNSIKNSPQRALLETILQQSNKLWGTKLSTLSGRDDQRNATANLKLLQWQKAAAAIRNNIDNFSAFRTDMGTEPERNRWQEAQKALNSYNSSVMKFEKTMLDFAHARTQVDQEDALKRVDATRKELEGAERLLKYRTLLDRGSVNTGLGRTMSKANAIGFIGDALRENLGPTFDVMNKNHNKIGGLKFSRVADALFSPATKNDLNLRKEWLAIQIKGQAGAKEILKDEAKITAEVEKRIGFLRTAYGVQKKLEAEVRTQVGLMSALARSRTALAPYGQAIRGTISAFGIGGGIGVSYYGAMLAREQLRKYMDFKQEVAGIQGVLRSKSAQDAQRLGEGILSSSSKYGLDLVETAKAARNLAQSGLEVNQVLTELDYTMVASKGMGITIDKMQDLQLAIKAITEDNDAFNSSVSYTAAVLEKVSGIEARYAVNSNDLADAITLLSPVVEQFSDNMSGLTDVFDQTNAMTTVLVERLRITGQQAGNALKFMFSRLARPEIVNKLQTRYGAHLGSEDGKSLLPLDALLPELGRTYERLKRESGAKANAFVSDLAGGRQLNRIIPLLEEYSRVQQIATESSQQWGGVSERAAIGADTMLTAVNRINVGLQHFISAGADSTGVARGLIVVFNGIATAFNGVANATGAGGLAGTLGLVLGTGAAFKAGKGAFSLLSVAGTLAAKGKPAGRAFEVVARTGGGGRIIRSIARFMGGASGGGAIGAVAKESSIATKAVGGFASALGKLSNFFSVPGVMIAGALAIVGVIGLIANRGNRAADALKKYRTEIRSLADLKINDSPQVKDFTARFVNNKFGVGKDAFAYGTAEAAFRDAVRAVTEPRLSPGTAITPLPSLSGEAALTELRTNPSKTMAQVNAQLKAFSQLSDDAFNKWVHDNPKAVQKLQKQFADAFIKDLPEAARKGFESIQNDGERIAKVSQLVSGAAFAANVQISNSIAAIHENTNRLIADSITGIRSLDVEEEKSFTKRAFRRASAFITNTPLLDDKVITNLAGLNEDTRLRVQETETERVKQATVAAIPAFKDVVNTPEFLAVVQGSMAKVQASHPSQEYSTMKEVLTDIFATMAAASSTSRLGQLRTLGLHDATDPLADAQSRQNLRNAGFIIPVKSASDQLTDAANTMLTAAQQDSERQLREELHKEVPGSTYLEILNKLNASQFGTGKNVDTSSLGIGTKHANEALAKFRDALLDLTKSIYEAVHQYALQKKFADEFGQPFNQGESLVTLGKSLRTAGENSQIKSIIDIMKLGENLRDIELDNGVYKTRKDDGTLIPLDERQTKKVKLQLANLQDQNARIQEQSLDDIFHGGPEIQKALQQFKKELGDALQDAGLSPAGLSTTLADIFQRLSTGIIKGGFALQFGDKDKLQNAELSKELAQKQLDLEKSRLPINATLAQQMQFAAHSAMVNYDTERDLLTVQHALKQISDDDYVLALKKLDTESRINLEYEARLKAAEAERALQVQVREDLGGMFSGLKNTLTDTSIWDAILNPKGGNAEEKARAKGIAIRNALTGAIGPIFTTIADRVIENVYQTLIDKLTKSKFLTGLLGNVETKLSAEAQGAHLVSSSIISAFGAGATIVSTAITDSLATAGIRSGVSSKLADVGGVSTLGGVTLPGSSLALLAASDANGSVSTVPQATDQAVKDAQDKLATKIADAVSQADKIKAQSNKNSMFSAGGMVAGNIGGTIAGGGGQGARTGSAIGSTVGALAGNAILPGIGGFIGGTLGGLLGGAIGGSTDDSVTEPQAVIKGLTAIERAQKETITAIQSQTDALLKPENRLFNLPATFSIPAYTPSIGPQAGGSGRAPTRVLQVHVGNITVGGGGAIGMSTKDVEKAFENAMGKVLSDQRNAQAWG